MSLTSSSINRLELIDSLIKLSYLGHSVLKILDYKIKLSLTKTLIFVKIRIHLFCWMDRYWIPIYIGAPKLIAICWWVHPGKKAIG